MARRIAGIGVAGVALAAPLCSARAATVADYLHDGWDLQGFANATVAQLVFRKQDRVLLCTVTTDSVLQCADISKWPVNEAK
jgi:hypothetical protein